MTTIRVETYGIVEERPAKPPPPFWLLLCLGIAWLALAFLVLQFSYVSVRSLTVLVGVVLFVAAASEFGEMFAARGWKWVHAVLGVLFTLGGIWAFLYPGETFGALSLLFGWYLLIKGTYDVVWAFMVHGVHLWWIGLIAGLAQIALAFWAASYPGRSSVLIVLWVGIGAALRGITTLVAAFQMHHRSRAAS